MSGAVKFRSRRFSASFLVVLECLVFASCTPWTVKPIDAVDTSGTSSKYADPTTYVDSIWASKLVPAVLDSATDAPTLLAAMSSSMVEARQKYGRNVGDAWYFTVKGVGKVLAVDVSSRSGVLEVSVSPQDKKGDLSVQIGPVLRGSALRDSTGLIPFTQFVNQLAFADVADDLNKKAAQTVLASLDTKTLLGKTITFAGSFESETNTQPLIKNVVPVELVVESGQ